VDRLRRHWLRARSDDFEEISDRDEPTVDDGATNRSRLFGNLAPGADVRRLLHSPPEAPGAVHEAPTPPELPKVRAAPLMDRRPITLQFRKHDVDPKLGELELEILRKLLNGETVTVPSSQRVRLELAGVLRETAQGIVVTAQGRDLAHQRTVDSVAGDAPGSARVRRDGRGRRLPFQRRSIF
jgi:hypothetical protein